MGSVGNQNPFAPYDNYRDCSQGICSIYCPQFCYLIFPPPPPSDDDSSAPFSPLIIAIIGVLASAFLLVSYYTIVTRYCKKRSHDHNPGNSENEESRDELTQDQWHNSTGLEDSLIKTITVCKYKKGEGLIEGTECAVCLSEFGENESLRLLPKCSHAFHLPCIDTWLKSHSNCPLCRANVVVAGPTSSEVNLSSYEIRRPDDLVLVVDDRESNCLHQTVVTVGGEDDRTVGDDREQEFRRSISLGTIPNQRQLLVSDILKFEEIEEYVQLQSDHVWRGIGSSNDAGLLRSPFAMKRSVSAGGFMVKVHDKGKNSVLPN